MSQKAKRKPAEDCYFHHFHWVFWVLSPKRAMLPQLTRQGRQLVDKSFDLIEPILTACNKVIWPVRHWSTRLIQPSRCYPIEENSAKMSACKRSRISRVTKNTVICNACKVELVFHESTTCRLEHLKSKHPSMRGVGNGWEVGVLQLELSKIS